MVDVGGRLDISTCTNPGILADSLSLDRSVKAEYTRGRGGSDSSNTFKNTNNKDGK